MEAPERISRWQRLRHHSSKNRKAEKALLAKALPKEPRAKLRLEKVRLAKAVRAKVRPEKAVRVRAGNGKVDRAKVAGAKAAIGADARGGVGTPASGAKAGEAMNGAAEIAGASKDLPKSTSRS